MLEIKENNMGKKYFKKIRKVGFKPFNHRGKLCTLTRPRHNWACDPYAFASFYFKQKD